MCRIVFNSNLISGVVSQIQARVIVFTDLRDNKGFIQSEYAEEYAQLALAQERSKNYTRLSSSDTTFWVDVPLDLTRAIGVLTLTVDKLSTFIKSNSDIPTSDYILRLFYENQVLLIQERMKMMLEKSQLAQQARVATQTVAQPTQTVAQPMEIVSLASSAVSESSTL